MDRLSRDEAAQRLGISTRTLDRRIRSGEIERETTGARRVYVLLDTVETVSPNGHSPADLDVAQERIRGLEELVDQMRSTVDFERERYAGLLSDIKTGALALPTPRHRPWWKLRE